MTHLTEELGTLPRRMRVLVAAVVVVCDGMERRVAFVLTQVLGLSYAEAAEVTDVPVGTIRSRVARAREELVEAVAQARAV